MCFDRYTEIKKYRFFSQLLANRPDVCYTVFCRQICDAMPCVCTARCSVAFSCEPLTNPVSGELQLRDVYGKAFFIAEYYKDRRIFMKIQLSDHFTYSRLARFCFPPIMMMVFISIYGIVDGLFVSNYVGKTAFAAINLVMPVDYILGGFGFMIGTGGSALVSKTLGEGNREQANRYFTMMVRFLLLFGTLLSVAVALLMRPISIWLGADEAMLPDCVIYSTIILLFNPAYMLQNLFQNFLTTAEKPNLGLAVTVIAGVTNMILDALFIAVFRWGVAGAAIATGISQFVGCILPLIYFMRPNTSLLQFTKTHYDWRAIGKACFNGSSELLSSISGSIVSIIYNFQLLRLAGQDGVAAYGVLMYIQFIFIAIFIGYSIGSAPIIGYHFGARNHEELKNLLKKSTFLTLLCGVVLFLISQSIAIPLAKIFVGYDPDLLDLTIHAFRLFVFSFIPVGFNIFSSSFFTALNDGMVSAIISFLRTLVFQLIPVLVLPIFWGLDGIWSALTFSELGAFFVAIAFLIGKRKKYHYF